jgi:hypothetical protein
MPLLGEELNKVEQAMDSGDLSKAWDMFKAAAKGVINGGKDMVNKAREKLKGHSTAHEQQHTAAHDQQHTAGHDQHQQQHTAGREVVEEEFTPEYYAEMEKFYALFDRFFKVVTTTWDNQKEKEGIQPQPSENTSSDLVYYLIEPSKAQ